MAPQSAQRSPRQRHKPHNDHRGKRHKSLVDHRAGAENPTTIMWRVTTPTVGEPADHGFVGAVCLAMGAADPSKPHRDRVSEYPFPPIGAPPTDVQTGDFTTVASWSARRLLYLTREDRHSMRPESSDRDRR